MRRVVAGLVFLTVVVLVAAQLVSLLVGMLVASYILVGIQCCTIEAAFGSIKGRVVLAAVAAFGLGDGLTNTGVTAKVANSMVLLGEPLGPTILLFLIYLTTASLSCLVSNQATVVIMYEIVKHLHIPALTMHKLAVVLIIGASSPFMTPFGTQTNLMVYEPARYSFMHYVQLGAPLTILTGMSTACLCNLLLASPDSPQPPVNSTIH